MSHSEIEKSPIREGMGLSLNILSGTLKSLLDSIAGLWLLYALAAGLDGSIAYPLLDVIHANLWNGLFIYLFVMGVFVWSAVVNTTYDLWESQREGEKSVQEMIDDLSGSRDFHKILQLVMVVVMIDIYKATTAAIGAVLAVLLVPHVPLGVAVLPVIAVPSIEILMARRSGNGVVFVIAFLILLSAFIPLFLTALVIYTARQTSHELEYAWEYIMELFGSVLQLRSGTDSMFDILETEFNRRRLS